MTTIYSPLSGWVRGLDLWKWVTRIDLGAQVFEGHLPPEVCDQILTAQRGGHPTPIEPYAVNTEALPSPRDRQVIELADWWRETAESEIKQTVAKAIEYGATDLIDIGRSLARVAGREVDDQTAAEWGIFFYLEGKLSRWRSAMERGDVASFDTLLDIGVYARMAQRVRQVGSWPGTEDLK